MAFFYGLDKNEAAQSSNLGMVNCCSGATFDVEQIKSQKALKLEFMERM